MVKGRIIVFIRSSSTARIPVYKHLQEEGYSLIMMHPGETLDFAHLFEHWIDCETNDVDVLERKLRQSMEERRFIPNAIVSFDEYGVYPAAQLVERFQPMFAAQRCQRFEANPEVRMCQRFHSRPLPLSPEGLRNTMVKSAFRDWCTVHKIGSPKFGTLMSPDDNVDAALKHLTFPCVVKPSPGAGSMLTKRVHSLEEVKELVPSLWATLRSHPALCHLEALGTKIHLLVEEFIGGQEVDVDVVVENGVVKFCAISDNFEVTPPYFCEQGGLIPSALGPKEQAAIRALLDSYVVSHGGSLHGVIHFEAKYDFTRGEAFVIEVNVRPGSAETHAMVHAVYGVHLGECLVRLALGVSLDDLGLDRASPEGFAASVNIYPEKEGLLQKIELVGKDEDEHLVVFSSLAEGSCVAPPPISFGLMAWMVASGKDAASAIRHIQELTASLNIEIEEHKKITLAPSSTSGTSSTTTLSCCHVNGHFQCDCVENSSLATFDPSAVEKSFAKSYEGKVAGQQGRRRGNSLNAATTSKTVAGSTSSRDGLQPSCQVKGDCSMEWSGILIRDLQVLHKKDTNSTPLDGLGRSD